MRQSLSEVGKKIVGSLKELDKNHQLQLKQASLQREERKKQIAQRQKQYEERQKQRQEEEDLEEYYAPHRSKILSDVARVAGAPKKQAGCDAPIKSDLDLLTEAMDQLGI